MSHGIKHNDIKRECCKCHELNHRHKFNCKNCGHLHCTACICVYSPTTKVVDDMPFVPGVFGAVKQETKPLSENQLWGEGNEQ